MDREALETLDKECLSRLVLAQAELIYPLTRQVEAHGGERRACGSGRGTGGQARTAAQDAR